MSLPDDFRRWVVRHRPRQLAVQRAISLPRLPGRPRTAGTVWAVSIVRNEEDVVGLTVCHLLRQGVEGVIVVDHRSIDGTPHVLRSLAAEDPRVHVGTFSGTSFPQGRVMSYLVHRARRAGADWVVLFDADEWWFGEHGTIVEHLRSVPDEAVVAAQLHDAHGTTSAGIDLTDPAGQLFVDLEPNTRKVAIRPRRWVWVDSGNHTALDLGRATSSGLRILHLPYRSEQQMRAKAVNGAAAVRADPEMGPGIANHWKRLADDEGAIQEEWMQSAQEPGDREVARLPLPTRWREWPARLRKQ